MSEIFISYARSTAAKAEQIAEALRGLGYTVWRDDELPAHRSYAEVIEEHLEAAKAVVVVWSADAVKSEWVQSEADRARTEHKLVQLSVDGARLPMPFDRIQCADLAGWSGDAGAPGWRKVTGSVAALVRGEAAPVGAPGLKPAPEAHRASICVLPFANMSDDPQQEYFSDGISEDIITDLSKVSALSVVARNTAFTFKGQNVDIPEVATRLNVSHVLEGSVRKAGGRVRITAQLIDGLAGDHVWAERYDRDLDDIFALQDEISQAIVRALKLKLLPEEKKAIEKRGTSSAEAYDLYLRARQYREAGNADRVLQQAIVRFCERAVGIDPNYAQAWTLLGATQGTLFHILGQTGDAGAAAIERALALDPELGEAHALKARELDRKGRHREAFAELERALRLDPESVDVNYRAGAIYFDNRRFADAARYFERAAALSESDILPAGLMMSALTALGDQEGARNAARMTLERAEKALARDRSNGLAISQGALALAALGQGERAREWIARALLIDPDNEPMRYNFACTLSLYLKDTEAALDLLEPLLAGKQTVEYLRIAKSDPDFDPIRDDPRFQAKVAEAEARLAPARPAEGSATPESA
jgi:adenylate cyclase